METVKANTEFVFEDAVGRKYIAILSNNNRSYGLDHYDFTRIKRVAEDR